MSVPPLTADEERAWRALVRLMVVLPRAIDDDLRRRAAIALTPYVALMNLSEQPGWRLRMAELAERVAISPSRMTRVVDALEADGLVTREEDPGDLRISYAELTDAGLERLREAWPAHLAGARRLVIDHIAPSELRELTRMLRRLIDAADGSAGPARS